MRRLMRWWRDMRESAAHPPRRFQMLGRWYRLGAVSGPAWQREASRNGPLVYTYYPEPAEPPAGGSER